MPDLAYLDEHRGYIGTSGSGKSTTARVDVEKLLEQRRHVAIVDITGIWYGLRSDRAGTGPGFDIPIFGGRRGDVPIAAGDGRAIGKIVGDGVSAIVDLSSLRSGPEQRHFMADFIATIREKPPGHFQLICDEADEYVPEKGGIRDTAHLQVAEDMIWIAKRGRTDGYVLSIITQRLADVANAAFSQVQTIFAHQLTSPADTNAFGKYVKAHGTKEEFARIMASLPSLAVGDRFLYRPRLHFLELGHTPLPVTFDSSRTPGPGEARREPKLLSQIDVAAIASALAKPREEAAIAAYEAGAEVGQLLAEKDARIRELEEKLEEAAADRRLLTNAIEAFNARMGDVWSRWSAPINAIMDAQNELFGTMVLAGLRPPGERPVAEQSIYELAGLVQSKVEPSPSPPSTRPIDVAAFAASARSPQGAEIRVGRPPEDVEQAHQDADAAAPEREYRALAALAAIAPAGLTEAAWAARAGYSRKGGAWNRRLTRYRRAGLVEQRDGKFFISPSGLDQLGEELPDFPAPGPALVDFWARRLGGPGKILRRLGALYPQALKRSAIAQEVGMSDRGGAFNRHLAALRSAGVVQELGRKSAARLRVAPELMGEER